MAFKVSPEYLERAAELAKNKPSFAAAVHAAYFENLGLGTNALKEVERQGPEVAFRLGSDMSLLNSILRLPSAEQISEIARIKAELPASETTDGNGQTDAYIESRTRRGTGTGRYVTQEG